MSRDLPIQPNLEHLRKQAKALLEDMRRDHPAAQLSDAQCAVARDYGFANWSSLRAHVQALTGSRLAATPPLGGRWTVNMAKSTLNPASPFVTATIELAVANDRVVVRHVAADDSERGGSRRLHTASRRPGEMLKARESEIALVVAVSAGGIAGSP
jgi:hypothetical protein